MIHNPQSLWANKDNIILEREVSGAKIAFSNQEGKISAAQRIQDNFIPLTISKCEIDSLADRQVVSQQLEQCLVELEGQTLKLQRKELVVKELPCNQKCRALLYSVPIEELKQLLEQDETLFQCSDENDPSLIEIAAYTDLKIFKIVLEAYSVPPKLTPQLCEHVAEGLGPKGLSLAIQFLGGEAKLDGVVKVDLQVRLFEAISHKCVAYTRELINLGADPNVKNSDGITPLKMALEISSSELCYLLIEQNARIPDGLSSIERMALVNTKKLVLTNQTLKKHLLEKLIEDYNLKVWFEKESKRREVRNVEIGYRTGLLVGYLYYGQTVAVSVGLLACLFAYKGLKMYLETDRGAAGEVKELLHLGRNLTYGYDIRSSGFYKPTKGKAVSALNVIGSTVSSDNLISPTDESSSTRGIIQLNVENSIFQLPFDFRKEKTIIHPYNLYWLCEVIEHKLRNGRIDVKTACQILDDLTTPLTDPNQTGKRFIEYDDPIIKTFKIIYGFDEFEHLDDIINEFVAVGEKTL